MRCQAVREVFRSLDIIRQKFNARAECKYSHASSNDLSGLTAWSLELESLKSPRGMFSALRTLEQTREQRLDLAMPLCASRRFRFGTEAHLRNGSLVLLAPGDSFAVFLPNACLVDRPGDT